MHHTQHRLAALSPLQRAGALLLTDAQDEEEEMVALLTLKLAKQECCSGRYGHQGPYDWLKLQDFLELIIEKCSPRWFKAWMRCVTPGIGWCHGILICAGDSIFISMGWYPQCPVKVQLVTFLIYYESVSLVKTASALLIAKGTIHCYCYCSQWVFHNVHHAHLSWPGQRRRAFLKDQMTGWGFPACIGIVDGSLIRLREKPYNNGWAYYC